MGTNFYWYEKGDACPTCLREFERKHIGKSSAGWCFSLRIYPNEGIHDLEDWEELLQRPGSKIVDEYGAIISYAEMARNIAGRSNPRQDWKSVPHPYDSWWQFHRQNHSEPGPNGLLRHQIGRYCAGHGKGTWDLIEGDFS